MTDGTIAGPEKIGLFTGDELYFAKPASGKQI